MPCQCHTYVNIECANVQSELCFRSFFTLLVHSYKSMICNGMKKAAHKKKYKRKFIVNHFIAFSSVDNRLLCIALFCNMLNGCIKDHYNGLILYWWHTYTWTILRYDERFFVPVVFALFVMMHAWQLFKSRKWKVYSILCVFCFSFFRLSTRMEYWFD